MGTACKCVSEYFLTLRISADRFLLELPQADDQQQDVEKYQGYEIYRGGEMGELRNESGTQSFAGVDQGVHKHQLLKDGERLERAPGVVCAAEKDHWRHDHAEHQSDVLLIDAASEGEAAAGGEGRNQQRGDGEGERRANGDVNAGAQQKPSQRNHNQS